MLPASSAWFMSPLDEVKFEVVVTPKPEPSIHDAIWDILQSIAFDKFPAKLGIAEVPFYYHNPFLAPHVTFALKMACTERDGGSQVDIHEIMHIYYAEARRWRTEGRLVEEVIRAVANGARRLIVHEMLETLQYAGKRRYDPHDESQSFAWLQPSQGDRV